MSRRLSKQQLQEFAVVVDGPQPTRVDRSFGLPTALYVATVGLYLGFIAVMAVLFLNPELAIPMVIFAGFVVFAFGVAASWRWMKPEGGVAAPSWEAFARQGIETPSGRMAGHEAAVQVLLLPVLILGWGLAVAVVVAFT